MNTKFRFLAQLCAALALTLAIHAGASAQVDGGGPSLVSDLPSGQPVGTTVTWSVNDAPAGSTFRLGVIRVGEPQRLVYDFTSVNGLRWTPLRDGLYRVVMTVRDSGGALTVLGTPFAVRATQTPVVRATRNPLVALYGAPACAAGQSMRVSFKPSGSPVPPQQTFTRPCNGMESMHFYVAGMLPETTYVIRHNLLDTNGNVVGNGPLRQFTTGAVGVTLPNVTVRVPPTPEASTADGVALFTATSGASGPFATDTAGNVIWYYESPNPTETQVTLTRTMPGGNMLVIGAAVAEDRFRLREIDLAGNTVRETNARRLAEQFAARGGEVPLTTMHHEARVLPNGQTVVLAHAEAIIDLGGPEPVDVLSDLILGLNANWQVIWQWDAFQHLDLSREATLGEICQSDGPGCPVLFLRPEANDWLHSNAIGYRESDGALLLSIRHQDWMLAIDYADGQGSGAVLWRLGDEGDFTHSGGVDPGLWQHHQHDNNFLGDDLVLTYDNGNSHPDCIADQANCFSRGQLYQIDENTMTTSLVHDFVLPRYSFALGSAQPMTNGNYHFNSGIIDFVEAYGDEITPSGDVAFSLHVDVPVYRSFRMRNLYTPPAYD